MELLRKVILGVVALAILFAWCLALTYDSYAADYSTSKELTYVHSEGVVTLTVEKCPLSPSYQFAYKAYAIDLKRQTHIGCWTADERVVNIWWPEIEGIGAYDKKLFVPKAEM